MPSIPAVLKTILFYNIGIDHGQQFKTVPHNGQCLGIGAELMQADRLVISLLAGINGTKHTGNGYDISRGVAKHINTGIPEAVVSALVQTLRMVIGCLFRVFGKFVQILPAGRRRAAHINLLADCAANSTCNGRTDI